MGIDKIQEKLKKIKVLADRGVGGERDSTLAMYYKLISKYSITEGEVIEELSADA